MWYKNIDVVAYLKIYIVFESKTYTAPRTIIPTSSNNIMISIEIIVYHLKFDSLRWCQYNQMKKNYYLIDTYGRKKSQLEKHLCENMISCCA